MKISRRSALLGTMATGLSACATSTEQEKASSGELDTSRFAHGVASGDPSQGGFVIWTRVTPHDQAERVDVIWEISLSAEFTKILKHGKKTAKPSSDWTVKIEIEGLEPGQNAFYRFRSNQAASPTGRAKTLPTENIESANFAVLSCSNYPFGYFNVYDHVAKQDNLDAVIHLGDYIYEYGVDGYGGKTGKALNRNHIPTHEILTLADYRTRHAQYKSDPASKAMHAAHPLIAIWDDHETANNSWETGAQNHQKDEGDWDTRRAVALQAYYEWMPVRNPKSGRPIESLYKHYNWGKLLSLATIETRLTARTKQLSYDDIVPTLKTAEDIANFKSNILGSSKRYLLGTAQSDYLRAGFKNAKTSNTKWKLIANQVLMANVKTANLIDLLDKPEMDELEKQLPKIKDLIRFSALELPFNMDAWDGYPAARERLYAMAAQENVRDLLVLTGDTHDGWANNLFDQSGNKMGIELGVPGVTSPGAAAYLKSLSSEVTKRLVKENKSVNFYDSRYKGYIHLSLNADNGTARFISVDTVLEPEYTGFESARFDIVPQSGSLALKRQDI